MLRGEMWGRSEGCGSSVVVKKLLLGVDVGVGVEALLPKRLEREKDLSSGVDIMIMFCFEDAGDDDCCLDKCLDECVW